MSLVAARPAPTPGPVVLLRPSRGRARLGLRELWEHRELLYFLVWRDVKVRYQQTILGILWVVLQPFMTMVVFSIFFGRLAGMPSDGLPYPVFTYAALLPWQLFAGTLTGSATSLVGSATLLTRVYFPRLIIPLTTVLTGLVDFGISLALLAGLMLYFGIAPTARILTLPLFVGLALLTALALGLWLSVLTVRYRDVRYVLPFVTQLWLFATPVAYPTSLVPHPWNLLYGLNPMVGVVDGFRWALLGQPGSPSLQVLVSGLVSLAVLLGGFVYFRRMESTFADVV